jgi:hypothetical protein
VRAPFDRVELGLELSRLARAAEMCASAVVCPFACENVRVCVCVCVGFLCVRPALVRFVTRIWELAACEGGGVSVDSTRHAAAAPLPPPPRIRQQPPSTLGVPRELDQPDPQGKPPLAMRIGYLAAINTIKIPFSSQKGPIRRSCNKKSWRQAASLVPSTLSAGLPSCLGSTRHLFSQQRHSSRQPGQLHSMAASLRSSCLRASTARAAKPAVARRAVIMVSVASGLATALASAASGSRRRNGLLPAVAPAPQGLH